MYILIILTASFAARAQQPEVEETNRYIQLAANNYNTDSVRRYADTAYTMAQQLGDRRLIAKALDNLAWAYSTDELFDTAIVLYKQQLLIAQNIKDTVQETMIYCNLGLCYQGINKYFEMWDNFRLAAEQFAMLGDTSNLSWAICSMGTAYEKMGLHGKAKELYYKSLRLAESINDTVETGAALHYIGNSTTLQFFARNDAETIDTLMVAKSQLLKANDLLAGRPVTAAAHAQNLIALARCYVKLASLTNRDDFADSCDNCLDHFLRDYPNDKDTTRHLQSEMLRIQSYVCRRNYTAALPAIKKIIPKFQGSQYTLQLSESYKLMSACYMAIGDYKRAYECGEQHLQLVKKSHDDETMKQISNFAAQTELNKIRLEHDAYNRRQQKQMETEQSRQRFFYALMSLAIASVVVMAALISIMLYRRQRANKLLKKGNEERARLREEYTKQLAAVADAQEIIMDSVEYASKIQSESIGTEAKLKELFPDCFVYYRPRDIVSGDWYYSTTVNGHKVIVAADCTGHGIPGAVLSMLGVGALRDIINDIDASNSPVMPGDILDRMRTSVKKTLNKSDETTVAAVDDGMDMTIVVFPPEGSVMYFGGANQTALIVRNGEVTRLRGDSNSIGNNIREVEHFATITTEISTGDAVYLFSDGIIDQLGGDDMRKFTIQLLTAFIEVNYQLTMPQQLDVFNDVMDNWSEKAAQLDDRLLIGIRI